MTLHLTYEEKKQRAREKYLQYREQNKERLAIYNKEYYINNFKDDNKYYNKKRSHNIYTNTDTKRDKERKLIYIMNYFISNNIIWT